MIIPTMVKNAGPASYVVKTLLHASKQRVQANNGFKIKDKEHTVWCRSCDGSLRTPLCVCLGLRYRDMSTAYADTHIPPAQARAVNRTVR